MASLTVSVSKGGSGEVGAGDGWASMRSCFRRPSSAASALPAGRSRKTTDARRRRGYIPRSRTPSQRRHEMTELEATARALVAPGKGILAADESSGTIAKRFADVGVESTEESRRAYRELLFTTEGAADAISGVILFDETIRQSAADGTPFPQLLEGQGVVPGIKVDLGAKPLALTDDETVTEGLDGLRERLAEYRELGARFAK